mgnify:CR=1 FL=1
MSAKLLIFGMGQYGWVVKEVAESIGKFESIAFLDDNNPEALGKFSECKKFLGEYSYAFVAIGNPEVRLTLLDEAKAIGFNLATLISPKAYVSSSAEIGQACIVEPMAVVNANAKVGEGTFICAGSIVNHNAVIGDLCQIDCNAVIGASATVSRGRKIESGMVVSRGDMIEI